MSQMNQTAVVTEKVRQPHILLTNDTLQVGTSPRSKEEISRTAVYFREFLRITA